MHGLNLLRERNITYYVLAVLTATSLQYPEEMFEFFRFIQRPKSNIPASAAEPVIMCGYTRTTGRETIEELQ